MYLEKYESDRAKILEHTAKALEELVGIALQISDMKNITGFESPTVIT